MTVIERYEILKSKVINRREEFLKFMEFITEAVTNDCFFSFAEKIFYDRIKTKN